MTLRYPAAERLATQVTIGADDDADNLMATWRSEYVRQIGSSPDEGECMAARAMIESRMRGEPPPLPSSASSSAWRMPRLEIGIPK